MGKFLSGYNLKWAPKFFYGIAQIAFQTSNALLNALLSTYSNTISFYSPEFWLATPPHNEGDLEPETVSGRVVGVVCKW